MARPQDDVLVVDVRFMNLQLGDAGEHAARATNLERAAALPGVTHAAVGASLLAQVNGSVSRQVSPGWFETVGLRFLAGRGFADNASDVAVINETWAVRLGGVDAALGATVSLTGRRTVPVAGVVEDGYERLAWRGRRVPVAYEPPRPGPVGQFTLYLRGPLADQSASGVRQILAAIDPALAPAAIGTVTDVMIASARDELAIAQAIGAASVVAVLLAAVGVFAGVAQHVARRTHEFGVRLALGATPFDVGGRIVRQTLRLTVTGGVLGFAVALLVLTAMRPPNSAELRFADPIPAGLTLAVVIAIGLAAASGPARRVMRIDPVRSLRAD
jgi:hypothetical protein